MKCSLNPITNQKKENLKNSLIVSRYSFCPYQQNNILELQKRSLNLITTQEMGNLQNTVACL